MDDGQSDPYVALCFAGAARMVLLQIHVINNANEYLVLEPQNKKVTKTQQFTVKLMQFSP